MEKESYKKLNGQPANLLAIFIASIKILSM